MTRARKLNRSVGVVSIILALLVAISSQVIFTKRPGSCTELLDLVFIGALIAAVMGSFTILASLYDRDWRAAGYGFGGVVVAVLQGLQLLFEHC